MEFQGYYKPRRNLLKPLKEVIKFRYIHATQTFVVLNSYPSGAETFMISKYYIFFSVRSKQQL